MNQIIKNILSALAVVVFGFFLLNVAFIFDALFQSLIDTIVRFFTTADVNMEWSWYPLVKHAMFFVLIGLISWYVLRSKLGVLYKAIYMTVPLAVVFVTIGILTYPRLMAAYSLGALFTIGVLYYFYSTRKPWLYYFTLILMSLTMLMVGLLGVEI